MQYWRAFGGGTVPRWIELLTESEHVWAIETKGWRVKLARTILIGNMLAMLMLSVWLAVLSISGLAQVREDRPLSPSEMAIRDHLRLDLLSKDFEKLDAGRRLTIAEQVLQDHSARLASIERIMQWIALGVAGVLGKSVLETLIAVGLRKRNPEAAPS